MFYLFVYFGFVLQGYLARGQKTLALMSSSGLSEHFGFTGRDGSVEGRLHGFKHSQALKIRTATSGPSQYF